MGSCPRALWAGTSFCHVKNGLNFLDNFLAGCPLMSVGNTGQCWLLGSHSCYLVSVNRQTKEIFQQQSLQWRWGSTVWDHICSSSLLRKLVLGVLTAKMIRFSKIFPFCIHMDLTRNILRESQEWLAAYTNLKWTTIYVNYGKFWFLQQ